MTNGNTTWFQGAGARSVDQWLRTGEVFAAIGDRDAIERIARLAERVAADTGDGGALARVEAFRRRSRLV